MPRSRLLALIIAIVLALGLLLWLVDALTRVYSVFSAISPQLGSAMVWLVLALVVVLVGALVYYTVLFLRPRRHRQRTLRQIPANTTEATVQTLQALDEQLTHIQDEVARQVLSERAQTIAASLSAGPLRVVVFGTGSAGKTSLINAMLGHMANPIGAAMGTTETVSTHRFHLRGLEREIWMTDTPGILDASVTGAEREALAHQLATDATLMLVVLDGDLRRSEYEPIRALVQSGKRSLIVLNKIDLYSADEQDAILQRLRDRLHGLIPPDDIVAIAAHPRPVLLSNGDRVQPDPDLSSLLQRMATVLRAEGEALVADALLLQSQRLGAEARQLLEEQRRRQADALVERFQWIGGGVVSLTPLPVVDLLATAAVNAQMVVELGRIYGCDMDLEQGKALARSLAKTLVSLGLVRGAIEILSITLQTNISTFVIGKAIQGVTAAYLTRVAGKSFIEYFQRNQDWGDGGIAEVVQEQFQLNRRDEFIKTFVRDAIARVVQPLTQDLPDQR